MSIQTFNAQWGPILVDAEATGPLGSAKLKLVLDTGATTSVISLAALTYLGIDPGQSQRKVRMTTGSTVESVPVVVLTRLSALGQHRIGFSALAHGLPTTAAVHGLLGLDFLRGHVLTIDFPAGAITLA